MNEQTFEIEDADRPSLREALAALKRRRWPVLWTLLAGLVAAVVLSLAIPPKFRSTGTILIEQQELPTDLVRSTVTSYADQRIQVISQRVMTTQTLLDLVRKYDLYPGERDRESREELLDRMREDINFRMISANVIDPRNGVPQKATIAFALSYASRSPESAYKVANDLTTLYLNENLTSRNRMAQDASGFLSAESDRVSREVAALDAKLSEFKQKHADALPELSELNTQMLERVEQEMRDAQSRLSVLDQQRVFLEAQLASAKPFGVIFSESGERILSAADRLKVARSQLAATVGLYGEDHPDILRIRKQIASLEGETDAPDIGNDLSRRLEDARAELAASRKRYSAEHPDVQRLQSQVASLEAEIAAGTGTGAGPANGSPDREVAFTSAEGAPQAAGARGRKVTTPDNPAYVQLQTQLKATEFDRAAVVAQLAAARNRVADIERKLAASPEVERSYRELLRELQNAQAKYQELRAKQMEAKVSENLESDRKGERFTLIDPPLPPQKPESPNRPLILAVGLVLSLALAAGLAVLLDSNDASIRGSRDLLRLAPLPLLAIVPRIRTEADRRAAVRRRQFAAAGSLACLVFVAVLLHFTYRPLDMLWFSALRRLGI